MGTGSSQPSSSVTSDDGSSSDDNVTPWLCVNISPSEVLNYKPAASRALLCTVNAFQKSIYVESGIPVAAGRQETDARKLSKWWTKGDGGALKEQCVSVLDDDADGFLGYTPTKSTILELLKEHTGEVESNGLLFFYFSGHARRSKYGKVYLLPTDYDSIFGQAISSDDLCDVLQHVRADAKIVVVLDCCEADDIAKQIMENEQLARCAAPVYVAFTCSGSEGAIYHAQLGGGVFSFFFLEYLYSQVEKRETTRQLSLLPALRYCKPFYTALSWLSRYPAAMSGYGNEEAGPQFVFRDCQIENFVSTSGDHVDSAGQDQYGFVTKFFRISPGMAGSHLVLQIPEKLTAWLRNTATPAMYQLFKDGFISSSLHPGLFNTVVSMLACSCARGVMVHERRHFLERNVFILCVVNILEVYHAVHESLVPTTWTREHLALALRYYMATLKTFYDSLPAAELRELIELLVEIRAEDFPDGQKLEEAALLSIVSELPKVRLAPLPSDEALE